MGRIRFKASAAKGGSRAREGWWLFGVVAAGLGLAACNGSNPGTTGQSTSSAPLSKIKVQWPESKVLQSNTSLTFGELEIKFEIEGFNYVVTCKKCSSDVEVTAFGKPLVAAGKEDPVLRTDVRSLYAPLPVEIAFPAFGKPGSRIKPDATFELRVRGYEPYVAPLPELSGDVFSIGFLAVKDSPIVLGPSDTSDPPAHTALRGTKVIGPAKTVQEIDWIALEQLPARRSTSTKCKYVEGTFPLEIQDIEVVVYERRTSKEVGRKLFAPPAVCPPNGWATNNTVATSPDTDLMDAWLKQLIRKR